MIELRKDMEDPEQTAVFDGTEKCLSEYDPEQTAVLIEPVDRGSEYDLDRTAVAVMEEGAHGGAEPVTSEDATDSGVFHFDGMEFRTPSELALYFQSYADISRRALSKKVRELYADKEHLTPEFESWLIAIGKEKELNAWKKKMGVPAGTGGM